MKNKFYFRITGIKVYDKNVSRNEIIMDMDLVFASDCDIKFSVGKIKAKIMDFSLRGLLRVVFKPIVTEIPLIGGVQVRPQVAKMSTLLYFLP